MKKLKDLKPYLAPALCAAGGVLIYLLLTLTGADDKASESAVLLRGGYGSGTRQYRLKVEGLTDDDMPLTILVNPKVYTEDAAVEVFYEVMDGMEERILAGNASLQEVRGDLSLPEKIPERGIKINWSSSDRNVMDDAGRITEEVGEPREVILTAVLSAEITAEDDSVRIYQEAFEIPVDILPPKRTAAEEIMLRFLARVEDDEGHARMADEFTLPSEFEGRSLSYKSEQDVDYRMIPLLGVLLAALMIAHRQNQGNEDKKKRNKELSLDYSDMLSKFVVLSGAGLMVRNVWEKMVRDYEEAKKAGRQKKRAVYEEMAQTVRQMKNGVSEQEAYRDFGRRCALSPYLKFSSLLEQNCRSGTKNLREILQREMSDALEERKNIARRLGEEAGTKLLLPLFLLLGIVMAMIMVPALMMMG